MANGLFAAIVFVGLGGPLADHQLRPPASWKGSETATASLWASQTASGETDWSVELTNTSAPRSGHEIREVSVLVKSDNPPLLSKPDGWMRRVQRATERMAPKNISDADRAVPYAVTWVPEDAAEGLEPGDTFQAHFWTSSTASAGGCVVVFKNGTRLRLKPGPTTD